MNTSKIIKGVVGGGRYTVTAPIIKEDYGLYLQIEGIELPDTYEVDFSNEEHSGSSVTMIGNSDGVLIPSQFIKSGKDVFAFLYHVGEDYGRTIFKFRIPNKLRPDRTDEEPTPEEQSVIDQTISALNDGVSKAQNAQKAIEDMSVSAESLPEGSEATVTKSEQDGVVHLDFGIPVGATGAQGERGEKGEKGDKGDTGASGRDGVDGTDGISPTVTITPITGGHRITITDADGEHSADVMDGTGSVDDVQINGTSIVSDGVAEIPLASSNRKGVVSATNSNGVAVNASGELYVSRATDAQIKQGTAGYRPIVSETEYMATFYGLAKAAGSDEKNSALSVGEYTEEAKIAIQKMLGIYQAPWELIREDTFTNAEEADHIIDVDANGEPFELTDLIMWFETPRQSTDAEKGEYGQIYFYCNGLTSGPVIRPEPGGWQQKANESPHGFVILADQSGGFMRFSSTVQTKYTNSGALRYRYMTLSTPNNEAQSGIFLVKDIYGTDICWITMIDIRAVTGTGHYKLYGRRKWN